MRLWTFQSHQSVTELQQTGSLIAKWSRFEGSGWATWKRAYRWMVKQMESKGIDCHGNAPIWTWHSCGGVYGQSPTLGDAASLLSGLDIGEGVQTIEIECPDELALLSYYGAWNSEVLDYFIVGAEDVVLPLTKMEALFGVSSEKKMQEYEAIQATLPFLLKEWVVDIRPLKLKFDKEKGEMEDYDESEAG